MSDKPNDKTLFAMDLTAMMAVEQLSQETHEPQERMVLRLLQKSLRVRKNRRACHAI